MPIVKPLVFAMHLVWILLIDWPPEGTWSLRTSGCGAIFLGEYFKEGQFLKPVGVGVVNPSGCPIGWPIIHLSEER